MTLTEESSQQMAAQVSGRAGQNDHLLRHCLPGCGKTIVARWKLNGPRVQGNGKTSSRMLKRFVQ